jgi:hypothetical protein
MEYAVVTLPTTEPDCQKVEKILAVAPASQYRIAFISDAYDQQQA